MILHLEPVNAHILIFWVFRVSRNDAGFGEIKAPVHGIDPEKRQFPKQAKIPFQDHLFQGSIPYAPG
jgi:hypothetical protein